MVDRLHLSNMGSLLILVITYDAPPYDFISSMTESDIEPELGLPFYMTYMTISTDDD